MADKDFFLSSDDAQTLGDINYMRKSVRVKHTFPKTLKNPNGLAIEKQISASEGKFVDSLNDSASAASGTTAAFQSIQNTSNNYTSEPIKSTPRARPQDSSMDMFLNMARNIGKK